MEATSTKLTGHGMTTMHYVGAALATIISVLASAAALKTLFVILFGGSEAALSAILFGSSSYTGLIAAAVTAVVFALVAFFLYRQVSRRVAKRPQYMTTTAYRVVTYGVFMIFALLTVLLVSDLVATLLSSLLLIGSSTDIGALYLTGFLPTLFYTGLVAFVAAMLYMIVKGKNKSLLLTIVLLSVTGAILLAAIITTPIQAHSSSSSSSYDYSDMFDY